jgi:hypothetical protein
MRRLINCLLICSLSFVVACGYRTAPVPYSQPEEGLPSVNQARLNRQGDNWVFRWQLNEHQKTVQQSTKVPAGETDPGSAKTFEKSAIKQFRVNIYQNNHECAACEAKTIGHLLVDLARNEISSVLPDRAIPPDNPYFYAGNKQEFRLDLPHGFFLDNGFINDCYYTIDYIVYSGLLSMASPRIFPADLTPVPLPTVKVTKKIIDQETGSIDYFLLLEWEPQQEALRHTLQKDGKFSEEIIHYGLNLYRTPVQSSLPDEAESTTRFFGTTPHLINSAPLLYGNFSLLNFQGRLSVRQVDRHGNESESVIVFDGHY